MNEAQRLYHAQARSDFEIFHFLEGKHACHRLHYLQMCTEKLGKAYFYGSKPPPGKVHTGFVKFLKHLSAKKNIWKALGFSRLKDLEISSGGITISQKGLSCSRQLKIARAMDRIPSILGLHRPKCRQQPLFILIFLFGKNWQKRIKGGNFRNF